MSRTSVISAIGLGGFWRSSSRFSGSTGQKGRCLDLRRIVEAEVTDSERRAVGALTEIAGILDQDYVATHYPNSPPGGTPSDASSRRQAREVIEAAERPLALAAEGARTGATE